MARPEDRFKQTIHYAEITGRDAYGRVTLGAPTPALARVQPCRRFIRDAAGDQVLASHLLFTLAPITEKHRVWVPGANTADPLAARRVLVRPDERVDGDGVVRFREVYL